MLHQRLCLFQAGTRYDAIILRVDPRANGFPEIRMPGQHQ